MKAKNSDGTKKHFYLRDDSRFDIRKVSSNIVTGYCQNGKSNVSQFELCGYPPVVLVRNCNSDAKKSNWLTQMVDTS